MKAEEDKVEANHAEHRPRSPGETVGSTEITENEIDQLSHLKSVVSKRHRQPQPSPLNL